MSAFAVVVPPTHGYVVHEAGESRAAFRARAVAEAVRLNKPVVAFVESIMLGGALIPVTTAQPGGACACSMAAYRLVGLV